MTELETKPDLRLDVPTRLGTLDLHVLINVLFCRLLQHNFGCMPVLLRAATILQVLSQSSQLSDR